MRLMRAYGEISSRTTKYALVVLAESLRNKETGLGKPTLNDSRSYICSECDRNSWLLGAPRNPSNKFTIGAPRYSFGKSFG